LNRFLFCSACLLWAASGLAVEPDLRQSLPGVHAITGVTVVTAPGESVENATLVVRDGVIEAVGAGIEIPPDARIHEFDPEVAEVRIYPGLIDAYVPVPMSHEDSNEGDDGGEEETLRPGQYPHPLVTPGRRISHDLWPSERIEALRRAGFTTAVLAPEDGLLRGQGALVNLGDGGLALNMLDPDRFQFASLQATASGRSFPNSQMGAMALLRQTFLDARWQARARAAWRRNPEQSRPAFLEGLDALEPLFAGDSQLIIESADMLDSLRAASVAAEFELRPWLVGHGREYQRLESLAKTGLVQILPLDFPDPPDVDEHERDVSLPELRHWHLAPENPGRVMAAGLEVAFTSHPHSSPGALHANLFKATERGLDPDRALAALTTIPAGLLGIDDRAGRLAPGYMANFLLVEGELLVESPALREVWIDGRRHVLRELEPPEIEPAGTWELTLATSGMGNLDAVLELSGKAPSLSGDFEIMGSKVPLDEARVSGSRLDVRIDGARLGMPGAITFFLEIEDERGKGSGSSPQGEFDVRGRRTGEPDETEETA
jgi:hypothetical protein